MMRECRRGTSAVTAFTLMGISIVSSSKAHNACRTPIFVRLHVLAPLCRAVDKMRLAVVNAGEWTRTDLAETRETHAAFH